MRWLKSIPWISLCAVICILSGCGSERENLVPPELENAYLWDEFTIGGTTAQLYAEIPEPNVNHIPIIVYFPNRAPSNPESSNLNIVLHLEEIDIANLDDTPFERLPDGYILGGPVDSPLDFNSNTYIYRSSITPYIEGKWTLEFIWDGPGVDARAFVPLEVSSPQTGHRAVLPAGKSWNEMVILAWLEPKEFTSGSQAYKIKSWRSSEGGQKFLNDSSLTIELSVTINIPGYTPDTSIAEFDGEAYVGRITLPDLDAWTIQARTFDDTVLVGSGEFTFALSSYKGN